MKTNTYIANNVIHMGVGTTDSNITLDKVILEQLIAALKATVTDNCKTHQKVELKQGFLKLRNCKQYIELKHCRQYIEPNLIRYCMERPIYLNKMDLPGFIADLETIEQQENTN